MVTESSPQLLPSEKKSSNHSDHEKGPVARKHIQGIYKHLKIILSETGFKRHVLIMQLYMITLSNQYTKSYFVPVHKKMN